jgi:hypothetical protein
MVMDASGTGYFVLDLSTGRYLWEEFTEAENFWFNKFESGADATIINHREYLTEYRAAVALGIHHPGKLIDFINDNQGAVADTQKPQCSSNKSELISSMLGLIQLVLQQTYFGEYIETTKNKADYPTRPALYAKAHEWLAEFQQRTGLIPEKIELTGDLKFLRSVGWESPAGHLDTSSFLHHGNCYLDWLSDCHQDLVDSICPIPLEEIKQAFAAGSRGDPIPSIPEFKENFPEFSGPSPQRHQLTSTPGHTRMSLTRRLKLSTTSERKQHQTELAKLALPEHQSTPDPEVLINSILQRQYQENYDLLRVANKHYNPEHTQKHRLVMLPQEVDLVKLHKSTSKDSKPTALRVHRPWRSSRRNPPTFMSSQ